MIGYIPGDISVEPTNTGTLTGNMVFNGDLSANGFFELNGDFSGNDASFNIVDIKDLTVNDTIKAETLMYGVTNVKTEMDTKATETYVDECNLRSLVNQAKLTDISYSSLATTIGNGDNNLIVDNDVDTSTPGLEFNSGAFFLLKKPSSSTHTNMILDTGGSIWSTFRNGIMWDTYADADRYNQNADGTTMFLNYYSHGDILLCHNGGDVKIGGGGTSNPGNRLGIGALSPLVPLHIANNTAYQANMTGIEDLSDLNSISYLSVSTEDSGTDPRFFNFSGSATGYNVCIYAEGAIFSGSYTGASDKRIKKNITEIDDERSLIQLRNLPCVDYDYIDNFKNGEYKTIGFIAQDVAEIMPNCIKKVSDIIPNEMRLLENVEWEEVEVKGETKYKLLNQTLDECSYKFIVKKDASSNERPIEVKYPFIFDEKFEAVYCYGKRVDDFLAVDKNKIFAVAFSATQEIDRIQQQEKAKLATAEAKLATAEAKLATAEAKLEEQTLKLTNLIEQLKANNTIN